MGWVKLVHVTCVVLSFSGFFVRGIFMIRAPGLLQNRWLKFFPHIVDTVLLLSAFLMLYYFQLSVLDNNWLIAKVAALLLYIFLGTLALRPGRPRAVRITAWFSALLVFIYIVCVALTKSASVFF